MAANRQIKPFLQEKLFDFLVLTHYSSSVKAILVIPLFTETYELVKTYECIVINATFMQINCVRNYTVCIALICK